MVWRLNVENDSLWSKVIRSLHGYYRNLVIDPFDTKKRGVWRSISDVNKQLHTYNIDLNLFFVSNDNIGQPKVVPLGLGGLIPLDYLRSAH